MLKKIYLVLMATFMSLLLGCTAVTTTPAPQLKNGAWLVVPFVNNANTPRAGYSAAVMTGDLLRAKGYPNVNFYIPAQTTQGVLPQQASAKQMDQVLTYARRHNYRYIMTGTVNEWRYKAGLDGDPAVSITLDLIDTHTQRSVWNAVASGSGWGRDSISRIAQGLIIASINTLPQGRKFY